MAIQTRAWPELGGDEWVRGSWPACWLRESNSWGSPEPLGTLILTNRRLIFAGSAPHELEAVNFDEFTAVQCTRHGLFRNILIVETSSAKRFVFRTKKMVCKQIEARSQMRLLTKR